MTEPRRVAHWLRGDGRMTRCGLSRAVADREYRSDAPRCEECDANIAANIWPTEARER